MARRTPPRNRIYNKPIFGLLDWWKQYKKEQEEEEKREEKRYKKLLELEEKIYNKRLEEEKKRSEQWKELYQTRLEEQKRSEQWNEPFSQFSEEGQRKILNDYIKAMQQEKLDKEKQNRAFIMREVSPGAIRRHGYGKKSSRKKVDSVKIKKK